MSLNLVGREKDENPKTNMLDIHFRIGEEQHMIWTGDDFVKMRAWTHLNRHIKSIANTIGKSLNVGGNEFHITDVQPVVGWALGTCWEISARRASTLPRMDVEDDDENETSED